MTNKELQRQRMMGYFIDAATEIIESEGVEAVSARRVAELSGYSYATIYNYFTDINHLLWYCVPKLIRDLNQSLQPELLPGPTGIDKLRQSVRTYGQFFVRNPHWFRFMFLTDLGQHPAELAAELQQSTFNDTLLRILSQCVAEGSLKSDAIPGLVGMIGFTVNGALLFYLNKRLEATEEEFYIILERALEPALACGCRE